MNIVIIIWLIMYILLIFILLVPFMLFIVDPLLPIDKTREKEMIKEIKIELIEDYDFTYKIKNNVAFIIFDNPYLSFNFKIKGYKTENEIQEIALNLLNN